MEPLPSRLMPMFPLGSVLFPYSVLPLQVFEPRYLQMMNELIDGDGTFGVVLIERGSEVGGGDQRFDIGTAAHIARVGEIDEARLAVVAIGRSRIRITKWHEDDPYPQADVVEIEEPPPSDGLGDAVAEAQRRYQRTMALASELGADVSGTEFTLVDDPAVAAWHLAAASPLEQLDRQRLLEISDPATRMEVLIACLDDKAAMLEAQLGAG